jgi:NDP-sugar pyrophosphorylase family protein
VKAFLLAAGRGKRLGEITEHTPKPMVKVGGSHVIERNLRWLASHGIREVAINLHHLGDVIENRLGDGSALGVSITYSRESEPLGTAGALKPMQDFLADGPF